MKTASPEEIEEWKYWVIMMARQDEYPVTINDSHFPQRGETDEPARKETCVVPYPSHGDVASGEEQPNSYAEGNWHKYVMSEWVQ